VASPRVHWRRDIKMQRCLSRARRTRWRIDTRRSVGGSCQNDVRQIVQHQLSVRRHDWPASVSILMVGRPTTTRRIAAAFRRSRRRRTHADHRNGRRKATVHGTTQSFAPTTAKRNGGGASPPHGDRRYRDRPPVSLFSLGGRSSATIESDTLKLNIYATRFARPHRS